MKSGSSESYVPDRGDIIKINFDPQAGKEQAGFRRAIVLSPKNYNKFGLALLCPITSKEKSKSGRGRFEVKLPEGMISHGVVLTDHLKSSDWQARGATFVEKASPEIIKEVIEKILALLPIE